MKKNILVFLIVFSLMEMKSQCGPFPFSVYDATLTCNVTTVSIAISTTVSPVSCTWASMPGIVSGGNTLNPIINSPGSYSFTLTNTINGCTTSGIANVSLNAVAPYLSLTSSGTICVGSSAILSATVSPATATFSWSNGSSSASIVVTPAITTNYSITATDASSGCYTMATFNVYVNQTCQDVWPGDANSDGTADNLDILELGLHYTQTGPARAITSNTWQSYFSNNWAGTISNGKNINHSDCNGDGTINNADTLAIFNNYNLSHTFKVAQTTTVNPQLSIVSDQTSVLKGTWGTASIYLGDIITNINNLNGVAFTVDFDNTLIETNSLYIEYQNSFIDAGQNLHFRKLDFANGKLFAATTHTINNNVNGFGKIATLHYQIKSTLTGAQVLNLGISQAYKSDFTGLITPLTTGTGSLTATIDVGLQEFLNSNTISLSPNPTNGSLTINSKTELQKIEVISVTGRILLNEPVKSNNHTLNLENYSNGIYFVNIYQNNKIVRREKVIVNK